MRPFEPFAVFEPFRAGGPTGIRAPAGWEPLFVRTADGTGWELLLVRKADGTGWEPLHVRSAHV